MYTQYLLVCKHVRWAWKWDKFIFFKNLWMYLIYSVLSKIIWVSLTFYTKTRVRRKWEGRVGLHRAFSQPSNQRNKIDKNKILSISKKPKQKEFTQRELPLYRGRDEANDPPRTKAFKVLSKKNWQLEILQHKHWDLANYLIYFCLAGVIKAECETQIPLPHMLLMSDVWTYGGIS